MKQETMDQACSITAHKAAIQNELRAWNEYAREGVVSPLVFRLGSSIDYMNKEAFEQFKAASISALKAKIAELDCDFDHL